MAKTVKPKIATPLSFKASFIYRLVSRHNSSVVFARSNSKLYLPLTTKIKIDCSSIDKSSLALTELRTC